MEKLSIEDRTHRVLKFVRFLATVACLATVVLGQRLACPWPVRTLATTLALALFWNVDRHLHEQSEEVLEGTVRREFKDRGQETAFRTHIARSALCARERATSLIGLIAMTTWAKQTFPFWQGIALTAGGAVAWVALDWLVIGPRAPKPSAITDEPGCCPDIRSPTP